MAENESTVNHVKEFGKSLGGSVGDLQFKSQFEVRLPKLDGINEQQLEHVNKRVTNVSPVYEYTLEAQESPDKNSFSYYVNKINCSPVTLTVMEFQDGLTATYFSTWRDLHIDPDDGIFYVPSYYEKNVRIIYLGSDYKTPKKTITLVQCKITRWSEPDVSYEGSDPVLVEVELTCNDVSLLLGGVAAGVEKVKKTLSS